MSEFKITIEQLAEICSTVVLLCEQHLAQKERLNPKATARIIKLIMVGISTLLNRRGFTDDEDALLEAIQKRLHEMGNEITNHLSDEQKQKIMEMARKELPPEGVAFVADQLGLSSEPEEEHEDDMLRAATHRGSNTIN